MWILIANKCIKLYAKRLGPSENIVESRGRATFLTHPLRTLHLSHISSLMLAWCKEGTVSQVLSY